ncbi:3-hydroxyacyl-CoA dehydrogenase NAD-binding domain-containing protein [Roseovarius aestuarii]|nr:3-hydroxyacyl-CoA dehydrogenase NAD-binding domain-containing protein [Roseovarius aestuarii]
MKNAIGNVGFGLIGQRWALVFAHAGHDVVCYDPDSATWDRFKVQRAALEADLIALNGAPARLGDITFSTDLGALREVGFVQENGPEDLGLKQTLLAGIEDNVNDDVIIASSSSALAVTQMQLNCRVPGRVVLGHPFNPVHLMLLVEIVGGEQTDPDTIERARRFYQTIGKEPVVLNREVTGHIALRLMGAMWREAIAMIRDDVASAEDIDRAFIYGPGVKWTLQGSFISNHLGADGMEEFLKKYGTTYQDIWNDLGTACLDDDTRARVVQSTNGAVNARSPDALRTQRDAGLVAMLGVVRDHGAL